MVAGRWHLGRAGDFRTLRAIRTRGGCHARARAQYSAIANQRETIRPQSEQRYIRLPHFLDEFILCTVDGADDERGTDVRLHGTSVLWNTTGRTKRQVRTVLSVASSSRLPSSGAVMLEHCSNDGPALPAAQCNVALEPADRAASSRA